MYLNYVEHLFILALKITACVSISAFASLFCIPFGITSRNKNLCNYYKNSKL